MCTSPPSVFPQMCGHAWAGAHVGCENNITIEVDPDLVGCVKEKLQLVGREGKGGRVARQCGRTPVPTTLSERDNRVIVPTTESLASADLETTSTCGGTLQPRCFFVHCVGYRHALVWQKRRVGKQ
jgi:hypothetical protein